MRHRWVFLSLFLILPAGPSLGAPGDEASGALGRELLLRGLRYFRENAHPRTGLVRDRAENFKPTPETNRAASMAATGFGLAVLANASAQGLLGASEAESYVLKTLRFSRAHVPRYRGWFVHFADWETGARLWGSEFSTIDTALFLAGALYAAQVFSRNAEIHELAYSLYREADFIDFLTDGGVKPRKRTLSMAYSPESGYTGAQWDMYAEEMVLLVLGLGHPVRPLPPDAWLAWRRDESRASSGRTVMGLAQALFVHQYSQLFLDLRAFSDGFPGYWENSRWMTAHHRGFASPDAKFKTLREGFWGFSAGDAPRGYEVANPQQYGSTVCLGCVVGSAMLRPDLVFADLARWAGGPYRERIWGRYGFTDSIDLDQNWFGSDVIGITVGSAFLALADSTERTSVWREFGKIPAIRRGLDRAAAAGKSRALRAAPFDPGKIGL